MLKRFKKDVWYSFGYLIHFCIYSIYIWNTFVDIRNTFVGNVNVYVHFCRNNAELLAEDPDDLHLILWILNFNVLKIKVVIFERNNKVKHCKLCKNYEKQEQVFLGEFVGLGKIFIKDVKLKIHWSGSVRKNEWSQWVKRKQNTEHVTG